MSDTDGHLTRSNKRSKCTVSGMYKERKKRVSNRPTTRPAGIFSNPIHHSTKTLCSCHCRWRGTAFSESSDCWELRSRLAQKGTERGQAIWAANGRGDQYDLISNNCCMFSRRLAELFHLEARFPAWQPKDSACSRERIRWSPMMKRLVGDVDTRIERFSSERHTGMSRLMMNIHVHSGKVLYHNLTNNAHYRHTKRRSSWKWCWYRKDKDKRYHFLGFQKDDT